METTADNSKAFWDAFQDECAVWATANYPRSNGKPYHPKIGITEELGELAEAIEKKDRDKALDAVADVAIYALDFMSKEGLWRACDVFALALDSSKNDAVDLDEESSVFLQLMKLNGRLSHHWLKRDQGIRKNEDHVAGMRDALVGILSLCWDVHDDVREVETQTYPETIHRVWQRVVSKRNWIKNPTDGVTR